MADLFIDRHMDVDAAGGCFALVVQVFCKAEQDADTQLIVEKTTLNVAGFRYGRAGIEADDVAGHNAEGFGVRLAFHRLVQYDLHSIIGTGSVIVAAVYMDRGVF